MTMKTSQLDEYQRRATKYDVAQRVDPSAKNVFNANKERKTSVKSGVGQQAKNILNAGELAFVEKVLGLSGEAGEVTDKVKKIIRDKGGEISQEDRTAIKKELGDTLWYIAMVAEYLEIPLSEVAEGNLTKLESRYQRGKLSGEGDER